MHSNRRGVLKAIGASGTITAISGLVGATGPNSVDIPVLRDPSGVREYETVPETWAEHRLTARFVNDEIAADYLQHPGVEKVGITAGPETIDGKNELQVEVEVWPDRESPGLPDSLEGVDVVTVEAAKTHDVSCFNNNTYFENLPGGVQVITPGAGSGTICSKVNDYDNDTYKFLTCSHIFDNFCSTDLVGKNTIQRVDGEDRIFGEITDYNETKDWAVGKITDSGYDYTNDVKLEDATRINVKGWVTQSGLESHVGSEPVKKMGITTGLTKNTLSKISISETDESCSSLDGEGFKAQTNTYSGDSGGPTYYTNDKGNHFMVGIILGGEVGAFSTTCNGNTEYDTTYGYQAEDFCDTTPYNFGEHTF